VAKASNNGLAKAKAGENGWQWRAAKASINESGKAESRRMAYEIMAG